jgi:restriction system protein
MQYVTQRFENTQAGLAQKDAYSRQMAAQGYHIVSEQLEAGHYKGGEQCCLFTLCMPCVFLAGRTPGIVVVTYGRDVAPCPNCGTEVLAGYQCSNCLRIASDRAALASTRTVQVKESIRKLDALLIDGTAGDYRFNWQSLLKPFPVAAPALEPEPTPKRPTLIVRAAWTMPVLERIFPWILKRRLAWDEFVYAEAGKRAAVVEQHTRAVQDWKRSKESFDQVQLAQIEERRRLYESKDEAVLREYWARVLEQPIFGCQSKPTRSLAYHEDEGKLVVGYALPPVGELPKIDEVRFSQHENRIIEIPFSTDRLTEMHRDLIIKIALVVMYRLFQSDAANALNLVAFNGTIDTIDRATGREVCPCVIAVQAAKSDLMNMNFSLMEPKAWLNRVGGKASENLAELSQIGPITG